MYPNKLLHKVGFLKFRIRRLNTYCANEQLRAIQLWICALKEKEFHVLLTNLNTSNIEIIEPFYLQKYEYNELNSIKYFNKNYLFKL